MIIVSACLLGIKCKYDGSSNLNPKLIKKLAKYHFLPICPEQLGGLTTPRKSAEILDRKVYDVSGKNVSEAFRLGAKEALKISEITNCKIAILKDGSPSCGVYSIYNGKHEGIKITGEGGGIDPVFIITAIWRS